MRRLRVKQTNNIVFIPQVWRMWWPFWMSLSRPDGLGFTEELRVSSLEEAWSILHSRYNKATITYHYPEGKQQIIINMNDTSSS